MDHPVDALRKIMKQMFPDREIDEEAVARLRHHCDEPCSLDKEEG